MEKEQNLKRIVSVFYVGSVIIGLEIDKGDRVWTNLEVLTKKCKRCVDKMCKTTCNSPKGPKTPLFNSRDAARHAKWRGTTGGVCYLSDILLAVAHLPVQEDNEKIPEIGSEEDRLRERVPGASTSRVEGQAVSKDGGKVNSVNRKRKRKPSKKRNTQKPVVAVEPEKRKILSCKEFMKMY